MQAKVPYGITKNNYKSVRRNTQTSKIESLTTIIVILDMGNGWNIARKILATKD